MGPEDRELFLATASGATTSVRNAIRVSWERSRAASVDLDRPAPAFSPPVNRPTLLTRAAAPVLDALAAELSNEPVCLILTDAKGLVLWRSEGDASLLRSLDSVSLAPGFTYSEAEVGTNGIGTALEVGEAILVDGAEHYTGDLTRFSCAGALITHPVTGGLLGVVDITTQSELSNQLLLSFAKLAAARIQERILDEASMLDRALLGDYHLACQHSGGAVIALGEKVFMMNSVMQQHFDASDQAAIIDQTRDARGRRRPYTALAELPSGLTARLSYQPTFVDELLAGGIVQIRQHRVRSAPPSHKRQIAFPGLAGDNPVWRRTAHQVLDACARREWVIVEGEAGVGKRVIVRAAHAEGADGRRLVTLDASDSVPGDGIADQAAAVLDAGSDLVILHANRLSADSVAELAELLQAVHDDADPRRPWLALTTVEGASAERWGVQLLGFFPRTVRVPPLRHHLTDVPALVRALLDQTGAGDLTLSPAALNQLMRLPWAGNVTQLRAVLSAVSRRRRSGEAGLEDLPPVCRSTVRRQLTPIEAMERDAIVDALALHNGDKLAAASALGMSRATIYRKIRNFELSG
ncbi:sigma-54-dependent Fis family transcriptional regulator [Cryptosporangium sp. NPDC051539]|uniref:sigma-54-dependent Fis family transcriptional regulator n=1 Tax=Cryptosporangium sp. NPDC051539 TaxID=3363962 RepID=UPI0037B4C250